MQGIVVGVLVKLQLLTVVVLVVLLQLLAVIIFIHCDCVATDPLSSMDSPAMLGLFCVCSLAGFVASFQPFSKTVIPNLF